MSRRWVPVAIALVLAGSCHQGGPSAVPTSSSPPTSALHAPPVGVVPAATTTSAVAPPATATTTIRATSGCPASALAVSLGDISAAAGTAYQNLVFTNTSTRACTLHGYPGVSFVDGHGAQIGALVARLSSAGAGSPITLAPGGTAAASLAYHDAYVATFPDCQPTAAAAIRVYPPGQTAALTVPSKLMVCANRQANGVASISAVAAP